MEISEYFLQGLGLLYFILFTFIINNTYSLLKDSITA